MKTWTSLSIVDTYWAIFGFLWVQCNGTPPQPTDHPLPEYTEAHFIPKPQWSPVHGPLVFNTTDELVNFRDRLVNVHNLLTNNVTYNSVNSLISLYQDFKTSQHIHHGDLGQFYLHYKPVVSDDHMNCVGLTIRLRKQLVKELHNDFPDIDKYLFYSAGESRVKENNDLFTRPSLRGDEKWRHVALALHFIIKDRPGYFFLDQSFNAPVVTLMKDKEYPHQANFSVPYKYNKDDYLYSLSDNGFVNFTRYSLDFLSVDSRKTTGGFYLRQAHDSILDVTEKRALVKQKRSIVSRLPSMRRPLDIDLLLNNGTVLEIFEEGKYFPHFVAGKIDLAKTNLYAANLGLDCILEEKLARWSITLKFPPNGFFSLLRTLSQMAQDSHFISQLRRLDNIINIQSMRNSSYYASPEYTDSEEQQLGGGTDVVYDNFIQYINQLTSKEVLDMWRNYRQVVTVKKGSTMPDFPWSEQTYMKHHPTDYPNQTTTIRNTIEKLRPTFNYEVLGNEN
uniref:Uncharacterized protein n=1 Tax=Cacopsylla melanoneura TaxID=428564 RepID=A0A8D9ADR2_9HEMI